MLKFSAIAAACLLLAGCAHPPSSISPATAASVATATAPSAIDVAAAVYPKSLAAVNATCPYVQSGLSILASCVSGGAAGPTGALAQAQNIAGASCTEAGKLDLAANDAKAAVAGPTPSNSGNSAAFLQGLLAGAAKVAPVACPLAKALLKQ